MAIEREKFGELAVEAVLDFERLERQKRTELPQKMRETGRISVSELSRAERECARKYKPGDEYAKEFLKNVTSEFKSKVGVARAQLQYGLIDKRELARISREAAREANAAIADAFGWASLFRFFEKSHGLQPGMGWDEDMGRVIADVRVGAAPYDDAEN